MSSIEIIPLSRAYIEDVYTISKLSLRVPWSISSIEKELDNKFAHYILAKLEDKVIGFGGAWIIVDEAHITNIAVHPNFRGMGIGDVIVQELISLCKNNKALAITLEVRKSNVPAQKLYLKHGFLQEGIRKGYYLDNNEARHGFDWNSQKCGRLWGFC